MLLRFGKLCGRCLFIIDSIVVCVGTNIQERAAKAGHPVKKSMSNALLQHFYEGLWKADIFQIYGRRK